MIIAPRSSWSSPCAAKEDLQSIKTKPFRCQSSGIPSGCSPLPLSLSLQPSMLSTLLSFLRPWMQVLVLLSFVRASGATLVNVTVDDTFGDVQSGRKPDYFGTWFSSSNCSVTKLGNPFCGLDLDPSSLLNGTWMGSTAASSNVSILFNGSAVYAFFVIPSNIFATDISYVLDDRIEGMVNRSITTESIILRYNTPLISLPGLPDGQHKLTIFVGGTGNGPLRSRQSSFGAIFDYALYTTNATTSHDVQIKSNAISISHTSSQISSVSRIQTMPTATVSDTSTTTTGILQFDTKAITSSSTSASTSNPPSNALLSLPTSSESTTVNPLPVPVGHVQSSSPPTNNPSPSSTSNSPSDPDKSIFSSDTSTLTASAGSTDEIPDVGSSQPFQSPTNAGDPFQETTTITLPESGSIETRTFPTLPSQTTSASPPTSAHNNHGLAEIIAGAVIGSLVLLLIFLWVLFCLRRSNIFKTLLPRRFHRARSIDTINSFVNREFPPLPREAPLKHLYLVQNRAPRRPSTERFIPPRIDTGAKGSRYDTTDPARERLLSRGSSGSDRRPILPSPVRFRPLTLFSSATTTSSVSAMDFRQNSHLEADYQRRISMLETEVQRLQSERDYLVHLTWSEELPDYNELNSPRNSTRDST